MKKLNLVFTTTGTSDMTVSFSDPKDGLTLEECKTAAEKLKLVLEPSGGAEVTDLSKAVIVTTTEEELE